MIEISFGKLVVLALIALIVLGPEKLPGAARTAGALLRRVRGGWDNVRAEVERELQVEEIKRAAREAAARAQAAQAELDRTMSQVRGNFSDAPAAAPTPADAAALSAEADAPAAESLPSAPEAITPPAVEPPPAVAGTAVPRPAAEPPSSATEASGHDKESPHGAV